MSYCQACEGSGWVEVEAPAYRGARRRARMTAEGEVVSELTGGRLTGGPEEIEHTHIPSQTTVTACPACRPGWQHPSKRKPEPAPEPGRRAKRKAAQEAEEVYSGAEPEPLRRQLPYSDK